LIELWRKSPVAIEKGAEIPYEIDWNRENLGFLPEI